MCSAKPPTGAGENSLACGNPMDQDGRGAEGQGATSELKRPISLTIRFTVFRSKKVKWDLTGWGHSWGERRLSPEL